MPESAYDVLVVGGGGAGMAAALAAHEAGASVLIVEASPRTGGSTALSGGAFLAAGTSVQHEAGFDGDTADELFDYYMTFNQWAVEPGIVRRFSQNAAPTLEWLRSLGVEFRPQDLGKFALERFPRSHPALGGGAAIAEALYRACRKTSIEFAFGIRVDRLLTEDGRVTGVSADGDEITAGSVVVTTGGFGQNRAMLEQHFPSAVAAGGDDLWSISAETCRGDGLRFTALVGAEMTGHDHGLLQVAPLGSRDLEPYVPSWLVYVNDEGSRFVNERGPYAVVARAVLASGGRCWAVIDEKIRREAKPKARADFGAGFWSAERILDAVSSGRALRADTLRELAEQAGMPPARLEATIETYNDDCDRGVDSTFEKATTRRRPLREAPFYALRMAAHVVSITNYGLRIDPDARVLGASDGRPIPGLFAAGEVTGNVMGPQYVASGNSVANAVVYGRIAGRSAAVEARRPVTVGPEGL
jgi:fumarate reductase flavoprotein subunit